jgi:hypothetical protein
MTDALLFALAVFLMIPCGVIFIALTGPHSAYERNDPSYRRAKWKRAQKAKEDV